VWGGGGVGTGGLLLFAAAEMVHRDIIVIQRHRRDF